MSVVPSHWPGDTNVAGAKCRILGTCYNGWLEEDESYKAAASRRDWSEVSTNFLAMKDFGSSTVVCTIPSDRKFDAV